MRAKARFCFFRGQSEMAANRRKKIAQNKRPESKLMGRKANNISPEQKENIVGRVKDLIEPLCEAEGIELIHLEYRREAGGRILRLYIDRPGGVTLDDCVYISRQSGDLLDVYIEDIGPYSLEVSSPGPNRPLGKRLDFEKYKGRKAKIRTAKPIDGQKNFMGILLGLSDGVVTLAEDNKTVAIPFQDITKANLTG